MKKKTLIKFAVLIVFVVLALGLLLVSSLRAKQPKPGTVLDEARTAGRPAASFPAADEDYFADMDGGVTKTMSEPERSHVVKGRNAWVVWTGGNDRFWDKIGASSYGALDLLKTLSSHPSLKFSRDNRWSYLGLVNEPCFEKPTAPDPERFGLWLDKRTGECGPDPFENEAKYPGVQIGSRGKELPETPYIPKGKKMPVGSYYGYATGIVGLRLFPNPDFDEEAAKKWDAKRYYEDPSYYDSKDLIRPYRVGMSCTFCHVGPDPVRPPADPEHPKWENLSNSVGAQYFWIDRIFDWRADPSNYIFQMFHTSRPGSLDTSLVSTDNINNPRTMNAIYYLGARLEQARRFGKETLANGEGSGINKQFNDYPQTASLSSLYNAPTTVYSPRVLKDGADSVGGLGALNRVYLNIGLFSEEWLLHFNPLIGGKETTPILIADARKNSSYWEATEAQTADMAIFFLKTTDPHKLAAAPGGESYLSKDTAVIDRGKIVFAENCARCHSSKLPTPAEGLDPGGCAGKDYLNCWEKYWAWTKTEDFKAKMREMVMAPDFLEQNYLSAEHRVPVTLLQTNACSPLATNAIRNNIWDNFSSETYKELPSVGKITVYDPISGQPREYQMPGGGRGYTRPPSLVSLWSSAPFLLNNSLGDLNPGGSNDYSPNPSVESRMRAFDNAIEQLLWPEKRAKDSIFNGKQAIGAGIIDRTTQRSYLRVSSGYVPDNLKKLLGWGEWLFPSIFDEGNIEIGPIPPGTPVSLLANLNVRPEGISKPELLKHDAALLKLLVAIKRDLKQLGPNPSDADAQRVLSNLVPQLMDLSKCPDYVINRGHYFGTGYFTDEPGLSDEDKRALIEYLKTF
jgi:hypothetical protein